MKDFTTWYFVCWKYSFFEKPLLTIIFNGFLYEEDTGFHCFLQAQNIWQIYFFHMMRNHENIEFFLNYAVFDSNIALRMDSTFTKLVSSTKEL